ncbi:hypothetical protein [Pyrobaculum aerophilum]|uniref:Uncharacterized protein n=2 Tax=Pyrobaculum aerophilum TaxID=13773 RepID=Q8ZT83_PYRAE|nr:MULTISPECIES: hypothetical protein [Pyrobaculum]AAL64880.1 hypothetical protein PAE3386 [Pyrobaculum aerophilum str. IM2]MCX8135459.1 hypothetical protein [Pyrobaculum aerophilum]HII47507.1 hypothetical protein [Pyrobaculum aerophilum]
MNLLHFIGSFHVEIAKRLDAVESAGETNGYMEWVNGRVKNVELYFLWFPKARRLVYIIKGPGVRKEGEVETKGLLDAIAYAERLIQQIP